MQLVLVEATDERWLFSDAEPAAVFFYQTELPCPTFQQIGETLLHLTPQLDGIDIGHSLHKVYALAPGDHRRHRRKLRHVLAVGPCGGASQRAALSLCKLRYPSSDSQAGSQAFDVPFERAGQCFVEIVEVKDRRAFRRGIGAKICKVGVATRLQPNPGARHARKIGSHDSCSATEERERVSLQAEIAHG